MEKVLKFNKRIKGVVKNPKLINVGPTSIPEAKVCTHGGL